jgi:hypothetical protein
MTNPSTFNFNVQANNPNLKGERASRKCVFGECSRFAVYASHTRFDAVEWFVTDAETPCEHFPSLPAVIGQSDTLEGALKCANLLASGA